MHVIQLRPFQTMTNGGSSEMSVSLVSRAAKTASENLDVLTRINKTFKWNFLAAIWHHNHQDAAGLCLSENIKLPMNLDS